MRARQRGLSFVGFIFGAAFVAVLSIAGMKLIPAYMQNEQIKNIFSIIAGDLELKKGNKRDIMMSFTKRAAIDNITSIKAEDIDIVKDGERLVLSSTYAVKIPLAGNISLCLDFSPSSAQ